jgi:alkylation response protein AidB-like acyl-CoA dehydrogenase
MGTSSGSLGEVNIGGGLRVRGQPMDFTIPHEIQRKLDELDAFIEREIKPLENANPQYFDHRREWARTDFENGGRPRREWEELLGEMRRRADAAGHLRYPLPKELGGQDSTTTSRTRRRSSGTSRP